MESGLVHTVSAASGNVSDVTEAHALLHGDEKYVIGDAWYIGIDKHEENIDRTEVELLIAAKSSQARNIKSGI